MKKIILLIFIVCYFSFCNAQGFEYDSKIDIGNGLYKIESGGCFGIIDKNDKVVVSVEYQDILFKDGKALLTKNDTLYYVVDSIGKTKNIINQYRYRVHPIYRYVYNGYIIVGNNGKWGFVTVEGEPLHVATSLFKKRKLPTLFDSVAPFVDGIATVFSRKNGWKHIDIFGIERYVLYDDNVNVTFRSSVYKGECIIVTENGIKLYQEKNTPQHQAVVKKVLSSSAKFCKIETDSSITKLIFKEGTLVLDSLMRASEFKSEKDTILLIKKPKIEKPKVEKKLQIDTVLPKEKVKIELVKKNINANRNGVAYAKTKLINLSNDDIEDLYVVISCDGNIIKKEKLTLLGNELEVKFELPAKFSTKTIKRNVLIKIEHKNELLIEKEYTITINRYKPSR